MLDIQKLKYDLAMQSALAATLLKRNDEETVPEQMTREFASAYDECCLLNLTQVKNRLEQSQQRVFESVNALLKDK